MYGIVVGRMAGHPALRWLQVQQTAQDRRSAGISVGAGVRRQGHECGCKCTDGCQCRAAVAADVKWRKACSRAQQAVLLNSKHV
jgi:hypothetical protein